MENMMKDPNTEINDELIKAMLGDSYGAWCEFSKNFEKYDISLEWRFYKDGGWLAKVTRKKTTIFWGWLSEGFFSAGFGFAEKPHLREGVLALDISDEVKNTFKNTPKGKHFSVTVNVNGHEQLGDLYKLIEYKKSAK